MIEPTRKPKTLGEVVRHYRRLASLSQIELAVKCECREGSIVNLENDRTENPRRKTLAALCKHLNIPAEVLLNAELIEE